MDAYEQGFIDKCAEAGVDPEALLKASASKAEQEIADMRNKGPRYVKSDKTWLGKVRKGLVGGRNAETPSKKVKE